ncbi:putative IgGFc-binding protein [Apostichopus japonicus]|uniref:Putative IgGFc-binding protein n=1 Tax=Stichopus japonicus TaxID=307972 RepID=A0A2G8JE94_STIJA|nr:putative IgGFc-binding protein [Apostichopus japonicus]
MPLPHSLITAMVCPPGTVYDICGPACPATCVDRQGVSDCPTHHCIETCRCPEGQVLDGTECVSTYQCGCNMPSGRYLSPGEVFVPEDCSQDCTCTDGELVCVSRTCHEDATCRIMEGHRSCICNEGLDGDGYENCERAPGICNIWGDPHYMTFDQRQYSFQGDCDYTLVRDCDNSSTTPTFQLVGENYLRNPSDRVSYLKTIRLLFGGDEFTLGYKGSVYINGIKITLPYNGIDGVLNTYFGLTVSFDGLHNGWVTVSGSLWNTTCGLCGDFDGDSTNDFSLPDGTQTTFVSEFGDSWQTGNRECSPPPGPIDPCQEEEAEYEQAQQLCEILINPFGELTLVKVSILRMPWLVDPDAFYSTCVYDLCETLQRMETRVTAYRSTHCSVGGEAGSRGDWRSQTPNAVTLTCPDGYLYDSCGPACPATCVDRLGPSECPVSHCVETCRCPDGMVLDGDQCVSTFQCGCSLDNGQYLSAGDGFISEDCSEECSCVEGVLTCEMLDPCHDNAQCELRDGIRGCYCDDGYQGDGITCEEAVGICNIWGDPHYLTFDSRQYLFQGDCEYTLVVPCVESAEMVEFLLSGNNMKDKPSDVSSKLHEILLFVENNTYTINDRVFVNDVEVTLPYRGADGVFIYLQTPKVVLSTTFGLQVTFDGSNDAQIQISTDWKDMVCGLCGNFDGDESNDFMLSDGTQTEDVNEFASSWTTGFRECLPPPEIIDPCEEGSDEYEMAEDLCYILLDPLGPFSGCHNSADPGPFYTACIYDLCANLPDDSNLCNSLEEYASLCRSRGGEPDNWRDLTSQCPLTCPDGFEYDVCGPSCQPTCVDRVGPSDCPISHCVETCRCPDGMVLDGDQCVSTYQCGCSLDNGQYLSTCLCMDGELFCNNTTCHPDAECDIRDGEKACFCREGFAGDGYWECRPVPGICRIWGDPHYLTFDDLRYDFQGECEYTLVRDCDSDEAFHLVADNIKMKPSDDVTVLRELRLTYYGTEYTLMRGGEVRVNGVTVSPPYFGIDGVIIVPSYQHLTLTTNAGLLISYDINLNAEVHLNNVFKSTVCGLCGNFDDNPDNDFTMPNDEMASDVVEFGESWQTGTTQCQVQPPPPEPCEQDEIKETAEDACYVIIDPYGPFAGCSHYVNLTVYYDSCVYDLCARYPEDDLICSSAEQAAQACREAGGTPGDWREETSQCSFTCPGDMIYSPCSSPCQPSCAKPGETDYCQSNVYCIETCTCPDGFLMDGDECVPRTQCGCLLDGTQYLRQNISSNLNCIIWLESSLLVRNMYQKTALEAVSVREEKSLAGIPAVIQTQNALSKMDRENVSVKMVTKAMDTGNVHKLRYDFQGDCEYTIVRDCIGSSFHLIGDNVKNNPSDDVSVMRHLRLTYLGNEYSLLSDGEVRVNDVRVTPPYFGPDGVVIVPSYGHVTLTTNVGLLVHFFNNMNAEVHLNHVFEGTVCGLCGNFDNDQSNEFTMPDGEMTEDVIEFANSWREGTAQCQDEVTVPELCVDEESYEIALDVCDLLISENGPFASCHDYINLTMYWESCLYDVCATEPDNVCSSAEQAAQACKQAGGMPGDWREATPFCPFTCPDDMIYSACTSPCQPSCAVPNDGDYCQSSNLTCIESCECPSGYLMDGDSCVPRAQCGCLKDGSQYLQPGEVFVSDDCSESCTCTDGEIICEKTECHPEAACDIKNGEVSCYCRDGYEGDGYYDCRRADGICQIWGDPHYRTFDLKRYDFQGECEYTLVRPCDQDQSLPQFHLMTDNYKRSPDDKISYMRELRLEVGDTEYSLLEGGEVRVNGETITLPYFGVDGTAIYPARPNVFLATNSGLLIRFDGRISADIHLNPIYANSTCGLCGNFDGNSGNEFTLPDGTLTNDVDEFGDSWKLGTQCVDDIPTPLDPCNNTDYSQQALELCNIIIQEPGPFTACFDYVDPLTYYEACVYDLCSTLPEEDERCSSIDEYAQTCREAGVIPEDGWRDSADCCKILS